MIKNSLLLLRLFFFSARLASGKNKPESIQVEFLLLPEKITYSGNHNGLMPFQEAQRILINLSGFASF